MRRLGRWHFVPWLAVPVYVVGAGSLAAAWPWLALPLFGAPPVAFVAAAIVSAARDNRRRLRLQRQAAGLCLRCGYSLTGNISGVCPACGTPTGSRHGI